MNSFTARIIVPYAVFASLWIFLSDSLLGVWVDDAARWRYWSIAKGWAFVLVTSLLLYLLLRLEQGMRRRAESRAAASEKRYQDVLQRLALAAKAANIGLWEWHIATNTVYLSPEWKSQLGYADDELPNCLETWESRLHPEEAERVKAIFQAVLQNRERDFESEFRLRHKDGTYRWTLARGTLELAPDGTPERMLGCHVDITERKRSEEATTAAKELAEQASRAKDRFLASLSHELRTPLTPVLASLSSLDGDARVSTDLAADIAMMRRNVEMEARLIDDLLDLTRISRGKLHLNQATVDAHGLIRHALEICRNDMEAKRLTTTIHLDASGHHVWADATRLEQVFWNLLKNAVKFTPEGGAISVRSSNDHDGQFCVAVADTGVGIEPEAMPHLFDAFHQEHRVNSGQPGGLGLGLAISKSLLELHGGSIAATSKGKGHGSTFRVCMASQEPIPMEAAPTPPAASSPPQSLRILLVEDDATTAMVLARLLGRAGHHVVTAGTVHAAIAVGMSQSFDILVSDIGLPDGSGLEVMRELGQRRGLKGIALSGYGMDSDIRNSQDAGFLLHLTKPIDIRSLNSAIQQVCAKQ